MNRLIISILSISCLFIAGFFYAVVGHGFSGALYRFAKYLFLENRLLFVGLVLLMIAFIVSSVYLIKLKKVSGIYALIRNWFAGRDYRRWLLGVGLVLFLFFTAVAYYKHLNLQTYLFDFGLEQQVIWNTANGRLFGSYVEVKNYLGDHFSLIILLPAAVYAVLPHPLTLFALQTLSVLIGAVGVFFLAKLALRSVTKAWFWFAVFMLSWTLFGPLLFDFHPISFAFPFLIWGIYALEAKFKWYWVVLLFLIACVCKEDVGILVGAIGFSAVLRGRRKLGLGLMSMGFVIAVLALLYVIPAVRGDDADTLDRYYMLGRSASEILNTIITRPLYTLQYLFVEGKSQYVVRLFLPVGLLFLLSPKRAIVFVPNLLINLLTYQSLQTSGILHYDVMTFVGIVYAAIFGARNLEVRLPKLGWFSARGNKVFLRFIYIAILSFNLLMLLGHPMWKHIVEVPDRRDDYNYLLDLNSRLPNEAILSTSNTAGSVFAERPKLQLFNPDLLTYAEEPDYIVVDKEVDFDLKMQQRVTERVISGQYIVYEETDSFIVLAKSS